MEQRRVFSNGEVVIKTEEGIFFHAHSESALPILIDKEDGEKLFKQGDEAETKKESWGVFYPNPYKRKLVQECESFEEACEERMNWSFNNEGDPDYFVDEVTDEDRAPVEPVRENITLVSGQVNFPHLTAPKDKNYEIERAQMWVHMINDGKRPTKWLNPSNGGTKVNFDYIASKEVREQAIDEFKSYLKNVNVAHGLDMNLTIK